MPTLLARAGLVAAVCLTSPMAFGQHSVRVPVEVLLETTVRLPDDYDASHTYTLVVALHGYGGNIDSFDHLAMAFAERGLILAVPRAPYDFVIDGHHGYDWVLQHKRDPDLVAEARRRSIEYVQRVIAELRSRYSVADVYLLGFSQGGALAYITGIGSEQVAGILVFGARFHPSWLEEAPGADSSLPRVFIAHGMGDRLIPMSGATTARDLLRESGYEVTFTSFGGGHEIPSKVGLKAIDWILNGR